MSTQQSFHKKPNHLNGTDENRGIDPEEKEGQAGVSERDNVNDPSAPNTGWSALPVSSLISN